MPRSRSTPRKSRRRTRPRAAKVPETPRFVGRDPSPVLDRYPPRTSELPPPPPVVVSSGGAPRPSGNSPPPPPLPPSGNPLITLDRGFDIDQFSSLLGETSIRVNVPREDLIEVLRRVFEFMGFGVYVYAISVKPGPTDLLKEFVLELRRVDYSAEQGGWVPFVEKEPPAGSRP